MAENKYTKIVEDIECLFAEPDWLASSNPLSKIQVIPSNFTGGSFADEFLRLEIIPYTPLTNYGTTGVAGQLIIQIFTEVGKGIRRSMLIADNLDKFFEQKKFANRTITGTSALNFIGVDSNDNSLHRVDYTITFRIY